eukprot:8204539-Alexandrium_andersonii.AAC.1
MTARGGNSPARLHRRGGTVDLPRTAAKGALRAGALQRRGGGGAATGQSRTKPSDMASTAKTWAPQLQRMTGVVWLAKQRSDAAPRNPQRRGSLRSTGRAQLPENARSEEEFRNRALSRHRAPGRCSCAQPSERRSEVAQGSATQGRAACAPGASELRRTRSR